MVKPGLDLTSVDTKSWHLSSMLSLWFWHLLCQWIVLESFSVLLFNLLPKYNCSYYKYLYIYILYTHKHYIYSEYIYVWSTVCYIVYMCVYFILYIYYTNNINTSLSITKFKTPQYHCIRKKSSKKSYLKPISVIKSLKHLSFVYWHGPPRFPFFLFNCSKFGIKGWYSILASFIELHQSQWEFYTKVKGELWPWRTHLRPQNRPTRLSSEPGKGFVLNLTLQKSFQLLAWYEGGELLLWLITVLRRKREGEQGSISNPQSTLHIPWHWFEEAPDFNASLYQLSWV